MDAGDCEDDEVAVVLDTTWTPPTSAGTAASATAISVRDVAAGVLAELDLIAVTSAHLDRWAAASGVIDQLTIRETSFWFYVRLRHWSWLQERILWAAIADRVVRTHRPGRIACAAGTDTGLLDVLRLIAARDGIRLDEEVATGPDDADPGAEPPGGVPSPDGTGPAAAMTASSGQATAAVAERPSLIAGPAEGPTAGQPPSVEIPATPATPATPAVAAPSSVRLWIRRIRRRFSGPPPPAPEVLRRRELRARVRRIGDLVDALEAEPEARLLVVQEHARQRVDTPRGPRSMNPYLDPIVDRLRGTALEPIVLDIRARAGNDAAWQRIGGGVDPRILPVDALSAEPRPPEVAEPQPPDAAEPQPPDAGATGPPSAAAAHGPSEPDGADGSVAPAVFPAGAQAEPPAALAEAPAEAASAFDPAVASWRDALACPIAISGIDLGPLLAAEVAATASRILPGMTASIDRIQRFLTRIKPAGILLADEYHRQDWMAAARGAGVPVAAVQHGMIYPHHNGYIHAARPDGLRLPQRTFVFGRWERDLLRSRSVYHDDEVTVGGSPRLDLVSHDPRDAARLRRELGVAAGERLVVVSGTWGTMYRRFHYPIALAALMDRPLPGVHLVIKLHPGEPDDGPYRGIIEGAAAARGLPPARITVVQSIDLYRLLGAADAHLGIHSTVLTEAVVTRTPNLLADGLAGADLLGYLEACVARPVRDGGDLLAALDPARDGAMDEAAAVAFSAAHFEPGVASERIAAELTAWLT